jgi:hypothetical protein
MQDLPNPGTPSIAGSTTPATTTPATTTPATTTPIQTKKCNTHNNNHSNNHMIPHRGGSCVSPCNTIASHSNQVNMTSKQMSKKKKTELVTLCKSRTKKRLKSIIASGGEWTGN